MLKHLILLTFFLSCYSIANAQQSSLKGQVSIHNSKYQTGRIQYVQNAYASAPFSVSVDTDSQGKFELIFAGIENGTSVKIAIEKAGLEVVNSYDLERVIIGRKPILRIYLTTAGKLAQAQTDLFHISRKALFARKDSLIARLKSDQIESQLAIKELEEEFGIEIANLSHANELLDTKIESLEKRLPEFAQELATVNLDFASDLYIEAYEHYKKGEIEKVINTLNDAQLDASYKDALTSINKGKNLENKALELQEKVALQIDQIIESHRLKIESFNLLFQPQKAIDSGEKIVQILIETRGEENLELAEIYETITGLHLNSGNKQKAFNYALKSVSIKESLLGRNDISLAKAYNNIAATYLELGDYKSALVFQQKAINIQEQDVIKNNSTLAVAYNNLALIHQQMRKHKKALRIQLKAINLPNLDEPTLGTLYNNIAGTYENLSDYENALQTQQKAVNIREQILESDDPVLAYTYSNLAMTFHYLGHHKDAIQVQQKAIDIQEQLMETHEEMIFTSYQNMGLFYNHTEQLDSSLYYVKKGYAIWQAHPPMSRPNLSITETNIAYLHSIIGQRKEHSGFLFEAAQDYFETAVYQSKLSNINEALHYLEKAINLGYSNLSKIQTQSAFIALRKNARYEAIIRGLENKN